MTSLTDDEKAFFDRVAETMAAEGIEPTPEGMEKGMRRVLDRDEELMIFATTGYLGNRFHGEAAETMKAQISRTVFDRINSENGRTPK